MTCGIQETTTGTSKLAKSSTDEIDKVEIRPLKIGQDSSAFRVLNEEWISRYFVLEKKDRETLGDPENTILRQGGQVFLAHMNSVVARRKHQRDAVVQDETAVGRRKDLAQERRSLK